MFDYIGTLSCLVYVYVHAYIPCLSEAHAIVVRDCMSINTHTLAIVTVVTNVTTAPHKRLFIRSIVQFKRKYL